MITGVTDQDYLPTLLIDDKKIAKEFMRYFEHLWEGGAHGGIELKAPKVAKALAAHLAQQIN